MTRLTPNSGKGGRRVEIKGLFFVPTCVSRVYLLRMYE